MGLSWDGATLTWDGHEVPGEEVRGFSEVYSPWTGRAWLVVRGPAWRLSVDADYGAMRASLRSWFADRPFDAGWASGRFPTAALGIPHAWTTLVGAVLVLASGAVAAWTAGSLAGAGVVVAGTWLLARLRDGVVARPVGLSLGPAWARAVPWFDVTEVRYRVVGRRARVWALTRHGGCGVGTVPSVLLPALRARVRRLGGLDLLEGPEGLDATYERWRGPATGIPWGLLLGTTLVAPLTPTPWTALSAGLVAVAGTALLGAAVEARATGWHLGGVFWATGAYAVVLVAVALGISGWL